jgi:hypothetical protein
VEFTATATWTATAVPTVTARPTGTPSPTLTPEPTQEDPTPTQEGPTWTPTPILVCAAHPAGVNVRSGNSTLYPVIGVLGVNDCAAWIGEDGGWYYIEWGIRGGWVAGWLMRK